MIFKVDENLPEDVAVLLKSHGFDAHTVRDEGLAGASDDLVFATGRREGRILLTLDRDFADIRAYPPAAHVGIVVLRPGGQDKHAVMQLVQRLAAVLRNESPASELWIAEVDRIRRRR